MAQAVLKRYMTVSVFITGHQTQDCSVRQVSVCGWTEAVSARLMFNKVMVIADRQTVVFRDK